MDTHLTDGSPMRKMCRNRRPSEFALKLLATESELEVDLMFAVMSNSPTIASPYSPSGYEKPRNRGLLCAGCMRIAPFSVTRIEFAAVRTMRRSLALRWSSCQSTLLTQSVNLSPWLY